MDGVDVMSKFAQMKTMLSYFLGPRQETIRTAFCNYLASEAGVLEDREFQTFRNEAVKILVASRARQRKGAVSPSSHHFLRAPV